MKLQQEYFVVTLFGQADIPREVSGRRADRRSGCTQGLHLAHKKPEYGYGFIPYLVTKNRIKITRIYSALTPCFRRHFAMFGDSSQVRACCSIVQMNG